MFVELPNTVEGLIHISQLDDDYYVFVEKHMALVGTRSKRTYRIGQPIKVKLVNVNAEQKEIDFKLLEMKKAPKSDLLKDIDPKDLPTRRNDRSRGEHFDKRNGGKRPYKKQGNGRFNKNNDAKDKRRNGGKNNNKRPFYKRRREAKK